MSQLKEKERKQQNDVTFFIPCKPISWNLIATSHWRKYQGYKADMIQATWAALKENRIKPMLPPVAIEITAYWKDKRLRDVDNIYAKAVIDTLVREQILEGDELDKVISVTLKGLNKQEKEGIEVRILAVS